MKRILMLSILLAMAQGVQAEEASLAKKAGEVATKGAEATERGFKKGGEATVDGLKKAGAWVGKLMQEGGEKLEKASK